MPDDKEVVTEEQVSQEETASTEEATPKTEEATKEQPLTAEQVQQMIAEETEKVRRQIQSDKDKAVAEVRREADRRVRFAEEKAASIKSSLTNLDPEVAKEIELAELRGERKTKQQQDAEEAARRAFRETYDTFHTNMNQYVTDLGIDPKDIDWGDEGEPLLQKQQRILGQVSKKQKDLAKDAEKKAEDKFKDLEQKLRKDLGLDSVPTETSPGVSGSDADFKAKFGSGELPMTKENIDRYNKLLEQSE